MEPVSDNDAGTAAYWRDMASEALTLADEMTDGASKREMLEIAAGYELLANALFPAGDRQRGRASGSEAVVTDL